MYKNVQHDMSKQWLQNAMYMKIKGSEQKKAWSMIFRTSGRVLMEKSKEEGKYQVYSYVKIFCINITLGNIFLHQLIFNIPQS